MVGITIGNLMLKIAYKLVYSSNLLLIRHIYFIIVINYDKIQKYL